MLACKGGNLVLDLGEDAGSLLVVGLLDLLFGKLGDLTGLHALLVLEQAVRAAEEAVEGDDLLQEAELGLGALVEVSRLLGVDLLLERGLDLVVDLRLLLGAGEGLLDQRGDLLER